MYLILSLSILANLQIFTCNYLEAAANYQKPRLERNNIVNKGVWVRNKDKDKLFEKTSLGNVFQPTSLDADRLLQTNFDAFANNVMEETPFVSAYVERARRSTGQMRKLLTRKGLKSKKLRLSTETTAEVPSLKSTFVSSDYPYEVAILLNNDKKDSYKDKRKKLNDNTNKDYKSIEVNTTKINNESENVTEAVETTKEIDAPTPKRSRKHSYGIDNEEPLEFVDDFNKTDGSSKLNRDIIHQDDRIWHQNAPIPDTHVYEVMPKDKTNKPVSERGLIRVIQMLTKTFKRIMKQHNEVKRIYDKFNTMNEDFAKQVIDMNTKFQDFDSKYSDMIQFNEKLRDIESKLIKAEERLKMKHKEMDSSIAEFENQQKKFLAQQKQFYTIQKVMLAQNEKIHLKQSMIAKTQSEISHRQNNFARILKKSKQIFTDYKKVNATKASIEKVATDTKIVQTTSLPPSFETVKLNLFSIPTKNKLSNQDELIIKEKDQKPIDDLVYKYYFNNTFIDNLMKNKVLNHHASNTNSIEPAKSGKNKRNQLETTILLPINPKDTKSRVRRWLNLYDRKKVTPKNAILKANPEFASKKNDPFTMMAKSFCNEIGQNTDQQALNWCIEKALRRLRFMDNKLFPKPATTIKQRRPQTLQQVTKTTTERPHSTFLPFESTAVWLATSLSLAPISTPLYAVPDQAIYFPDNDELESNLKQYDLTPDTEGNVYYDGSLHLSDLEKNGHVNTQAEMNPFAVDLKSKRRAYFTRLNEDILSRMKARTL